MACKYILKEYVNKKIKVFVSVEPTSDIDIKEYWDKLDYVFIGGEKKIKPNNCSKVRRAI